MEIILTQTVENLGARGEVVRVADGYARNYLFPRRMAIPKTKGNLKVAEHLRAVEKRREDRRRREAEAQAARFRELSVTIPVRVGESGRLYGSVTAQDITQAFLEQHQVEIDRRHIHLEEPIRTLGTQFVRLHLHQDVHAELMINVVALEGEKPVQEKLPAKPGAGSGKTTPGEAAG